MKLPTSKEIRVLSLCPWPLAGSARSSSTSSLARIELTKYLARRYIPRARYRLIAPSFWRVSSVNATYRSSSRSAAPARNLFWPARNTARCEIFFFGTGTPGDDTAPAAGNNFFAVTRIRGAAAEIMLWLIFIFLRSES